jgi:hypothetical protein
VIAEFSVEFRAGPHLPYAITLEVLSDLAGGQGGAAAPGLAEMVTQDLAGITSNGTAIGDSGLVAAIVAVGLTVNRAVGAAGPAPLTPAALRPLLPPIAQAQATAAALDSTAAAQIAALPMLATPGATPAGPGALADFGLSLASAAAAANRSARLQATSQALNRLATNLTTAAGAAGNGGSTTTTGSTDLYHLAAAAYGDARGWTRIAQVNQLTDPAISGITRLLIPAADSSAATGVLNV